MYRTNVIVTLAVEALHCWPKAQEMLPEVGYLSHPHRHQFHITASKKVSHDDRDVEIIMFKRKIHHYLIDRYLDINTAMIDFKSRSCEMIARELIQVFGLEYCMVLEDDENGAEVFKEPFDTWADVVMVCGYTCSGKRTFIKNNLPDHEVIVVSDIVKDIVNSSNTSDLNDTEDLDNQIIAKLTDQVNELIYKRKKIAIDGIRQPSILTAMQKLCENTVLGVKARGPVPYQIVWLEVPFKELEDRYEARSRDSDDMLFSDVMEKNLKMGAGDIRTMIFSNQHSNLEEKYKIINH